MSLTLPSKSQKAFKKLDAEDERLHPPHEGKVLIALFAIPLLFLLLNLFAQDHHARAAAVVGMFLGADFTGLAAWIMHRNSVERKQ
jgi:hypothetical protein